MLVVVPDDEKHLYQEEVIHLPNIVNHYCPEPKPEITPAAVLENGYVTFGSFNRLAKVSDGSFKAWAEIMVAVPDSKMLFKIGADNIDTTKANIIDKFEAKGVSGDRLIFIGKTAWMTHMDTFNQVDIMLDPFPHGGGVTTLESLVMGAPVVTLNWPTIVGRLSTSVLTSVGMTDWVATTKSGYVQLAVEKASDVDGLVEVKKGLREKFNESIIGDSVEYCKAVEEEYLKMWSKYVGKN